MFLQMVQVKARLADVLLLLNISAHVYSILVIAL